MAEIRKETETTGKAEERRTIRQRLADGLRGAAEKLETIQPAELAKSACKSVALVAGGAGAGALLYGALKNEEANGYPTLMEPDVEPDVIDVLPVSAVSEPQEETV